MSNSTEFNGSFDKETVQQAVQMNHFAFTNMIMHRTTTADQNGHGHHWVFLLNLMGLRNWLHLKKYCSFLSTIYIACQVKGENLDELFKHESEPFPTTLSS